jgi:hypothetical protein
LSYGRTEEQADMDHFQKNDLLDSKKWKSLAKKEEKG